jgi:site-specific DNA-methyltransferase (adenine-specific)
VYLRENEIYNADSIEAMRRIEDKSIDLILCDLPYGITARNTWDTPIDPRLLWEQYRRIIKDDGAVVLFGSGMFTATMMQAGASMWRYNLVWRKTTPTGFYNAKRCPLRAHEDIMVFYRKQPTYNPQKSHGHPRKVSTAKHKRNSEKSLCYNEAKATTYDSTERFPTSVITFSTDKQRCSLHPTQKPVELLRWLIRTYTNEGDLVLDNACGSGSTCVAAALEKRNYIGIDNGVCEQAQSPFYGIPWAEISKKRLAQL